MVTPLLFKYLRKKNLSVMLIVFLIIFVISMQVIQQVYVAEDWVQNANNKLDIET